MVLQFWRVDMCRNVRVQIFRQRSRVEYTDCLVFQPFDDIRSQYHIVQTVR